MVLLTALPASHKRRGPSPQGNISEPPQPCRDGGAPAEEAITWCLHWHWSTEKGEELSISFSWVSGEKKWEKNMGRQKKALPQISKLSNLTGWLRKGRRAIRNWGSLEQSYKMSRKYAVLAWSAPASHSGCKGGKPARSCLGWNKVVEDSSLATWWW